jgi:GNAT superfamily N-acetyltransferase
MEFTPTMRGDELLSWESQVCQYPYKGEPGVSYFAGVVEDVGTVHCLLYRDDKGHVIGILNYFDFVSVWQKPGDVNIWIHKRHQGEGVGKALWTEAVRRWNVKLQNQTKMTPAGAAFAEAMMREGINGIQD